MFFRLDFFSYLFFGFLGLSVFLLTSNLEGVFCLIWRTIFKIYFCFIYLFKSIKYIILMESDSWPRPKTLSPQIRLIIIKKEKENTRWRKERELTFCSEPKTLLLGLFWLSKYAEFQNFPRSLHKSCNTRYNSILLLQNHLVKFISIIEIPFQF